MLVEDDSDLKDQLIAALAAKGYPVRWTASIREALCLARRQHPKVIVSDVRLPDGDGRSLLEAVRTDPVLKSLQFVLMTGYHRDTPQRTGMNLGADDYLAKPFAVEDFVACIKSRLERAEFWQRTTEQKAVTHLRGIASRNLPHEFFTPLSGILGFSELLLEDLETSSKEEVRESIEHIQSSAERLHRTLQNYIFILEMMDMAPAENPREARCGLDGLCLDLERTVISAAERHHRSEDLRLFCKLDVEGREIPVFPNEVAKIADELVDNAFKFSARNEPVEVSLTDQDNVLFLSVRNYGRGISPAQIAGIGAFRQFDRTRFEQQGLGLGLTIAQRLVERSQGRFHIRSNEDEGTLVTVRWPFLSDPGEPS